MVIASVLLSCLMLVLSIITIVGNTAVLLSYYLDKNIRQPTNYFIFSLAFSDLLIGLEGIPVYTAFYLNDNIWIWGDILCDLWLSIDYIVCLASIYTVLGITVDRYCSVKKPATYRNWRTPRRVVLIIIVIWLVPSVLFSLSIFGYGTFTGTGRILKETECYVQFMTNPYLNMGMYISYYWTTLIVMLYLYCGIYRAAKKLALKSDQKTKRLALLTEMRKPEFSVRTSDAANSSSDSPNDTSNSSKCYRSNQAPTTTSCETSQPVRNHMTLHNNNIDHTKASLQDDAKQHLQEPSSVIERESTAPCVSPEPSEHSHEEHEHPHFKPQISLPFIDADSVSSMVGNDDLRRALSTRRISRRNKSPEPVQSEDNNNNNNETPANNQEMPNEVKVPLIAVSRVESVKTSKVQRILTAMRSRSVRSKRRKRNKKEYKSRSENRARKALRTITFILGSFIILWTPFYVLATIYGFCESCKASPSFNTLYTISYYLCYMNSPLNPFCYAMANQQFKKTLTRIFKGDFRRV